MHVGEESKSLRKAQIRRKEMGMAGTNGGRKIWGKECGNRMSRELEWTSGLGRRFSCRVWPPSLRPEHPGEGSKEHLVGRGAERVNGPGRVSTTIGETDGNKVQSHLPGGLRSL